MLGETGHKEVYSVAPKNLLMMALVASRLPWLPVVCMEDASLPVLANYLWNCEKETENIRLQSKSFMQMFDNYLLTSCETRNEGLLSD